MLKNFLIKILLIFLIFATPNLKVFALAYQSSEGCYGDYNHDGEVNIADFGEFAKRYKVTLTNCQDDVAGYDCTLNSRDFLEFAKVYRTDLCKSTTETRRLVLNVDPNFTRAKLPVPMQIWHERLINSFTHPDPYPNPYEAATTRDQYALGRTVNNHITALLAALRATGDPAILAEIDKIMEILRASLLRTDTGCEAYDLCEAAQHIDVMLNHAMIASATYAFYVNQNYSPTYKERTQFWLDYLINHFEKKLRTQADGTMNLDPTFTNEDLTHIYVQFIRYSYYLYEMVSDPVAKQRYFIDYTRRETISSTKIFLNRTVNGSIAKIWEHRQPWNYNANGELVYYNPRAYGCQSTSYAVYTFGAVLDLGMNSAFYFRNPETRAAFAKTMSSIIVPDNATSTTILKPDVCGGVILPGESVTLSFNDQDPFSRSRIWTNPGQAIWDSSNKLKTLYENLYNSVEANKLQPKHVFIPAYMLAVERVRN